MGQPPRRFLRGFLGVAILGLSMATPARAVEFSQALPAIPMGFASGTAATPTWTTSGPPGGLISSLAVDPVHAGVVYAGTSSGLFRSTDGGGTWNLVALDKQALFGLALHPRTPRIMFVGVPGAMLRSEDRGKDWTVVLHDVFTSAPVIDPDHPWIAYVLAKSVFSSTTGVLKSTDGGRSWHRIGDGIPLHAEPNALAMDPGDPRTLYLGTVARGLFVSHDGGRSWNHVEIGVRQRVFVGFVEVGPPGDSTVYAGIPKFLDSSPFGLFRSEPDGSWTRVFGGSIRSLAVDPHGGTVYLDPARGSLLISHDRGDTWVSAGPTYGNRDGFVAFDPLHPGTLFAGAGDLLKSTNGGATWSVSQEGLIPGRYVRTLAGSASDPDLLFAGTDTGVFRSADGGESWIRASDGLPPRPVTALAIHPTNPDIALAGVLLRGVFVQSRLFRTIDGGTSWSPILGEIPLRTTFSELEFDPLHPNRVYAATNRGVLRSRDGGLRWDLRIDGFTGGASDVAVDPVDPRTVYATTEFWERFLRSDDLGRKWIELTDDRLGDRVEADPSVPGVVYVGGASTEGGAGGLFRSTDGGESWEQLAPFAVRVIEVDPTDSETIYAGLVEVLVSRDDGATWDVLLPLPVQANLNDLVMSADGAHVHAATTHGVYDLQVAG